MAVRVECDKCKRVEEISTMGNAWPKDMHAISVDGTSKSDKVLCTDCLENYDAFKAGVQAGATLKLLEWFNRYEQG